LIYILYIFYGLNI